MIEELIIEECYRLEDSISTLYIFNEHITKDILGFEEPVFLMIYDDLFNALDDDWCKCNNLLTHKDIANYIAHFMFIDGMKLSQIDAFKGFDDMNVMLAGGEQKIVNKYQQV